MTDKAALQKLFEAALKDNSDFKKPPTRLVPSPTFPSQAAMTPLPFPTAPQPGAEVPKRDSAALPFTTPLPSGGPGGASSEELQTLLDEQRDRLSRKARNASLATLALLFALGGGVYAWFVQSPSRVRAYQTTVQEVRSAGDIFSIVAKYQIALDRIESHAKSVDMATESMGISSNQDQASDVHFGQEMKAMMGGEGKTAADRHGMLTGIEIPEKKF
jgi:hypothetical protein